MGSLTFQNPAALKFLYFLPLIFISYFWIFLRKQKTLKEYAKIEIIAAQSRLPKFQDFVTQALVLVLIIAALIFVLARPLKEELIYEIDKKSVSIIFIVDCSKSMSAETEIFDLPGIKTSQGRLGEVKRALVDFAKPTNLSWGYRLGLVAFAADVMQLAPLSHHYSSFLSQINFLSTDLFTQQGTNLELAVREAVMSFDDKSKLRIVVLLSDGEEEENNKSDVRAAIEEAKKNHVKIYTVLSGRGRALLKFKYVKHVPSQNMTTLEIVEEDLWTTPDPKMLEYIARETGGEFYQMDEKGILISKLRQVLNQADTQAKIQVPLKKDASSYFTFAALVFLVLFWLSQTRIRH